MALVAYSMSLGMNKNELLKSAPRVGEAPFDSNRKMMSTIHKTADGILQFTKGAPDEILKHRTKIFKNGEVSPLTDADRDAVLKITTATFPFNPNKSSRYMKNSPPNDNLRRLFKTGLFPIIEILQIH